jgi:hypothetical protein
MFCNYTKILFYLTHSFKATARPSPQKVVRPYNYQVYDPTQPVPIPPNIVYRTLPHSAVVARKTPQPLLDTSSVHKESSRASPYPPTHPATSALPVDFQLSSPSPGVQAPQRVSTPIACSPLASIDAQNHVIAMSMSPPHFAPPMQAAVLPYVPAVQADTSDWQDVD